MTLRWRATVLLSPILRMLPQWWRVRIYARLCGAPFAQGGFGRKVVSRSVAPHGFTMRLRLDDWMERMAALLGIYYEVAATQTVLKLLGPGDTFIDVGANVGFMTLTAARCIGETGRVVAFEPNSDLFERLGRVLADNRLANVSLRQLALGDAPSLAYLAGPEHEGAKTLRGMSTTGQPVEVVRGDDLIDEVGDDARVLVKIDVEGFEQKVLQGMPSLIARRSTAFLIEVTDAWLRESGGSAQAIFDMMQQNGHSAFLPHLDAGSRFTLVPLSRPDPDTHQYDVVFLRRDEGWACV